MIVIMSIKNLIFLTSVWLLSAVCNAQDSEVADTIQTEDKSTHYAISVMPRIDWTPVPNTYFIHAGGGFQLGIQDKYFIGGYGLAMLGKLTRRVVFPSVFSYEYYEYGGMFGVKVFETGSFSILPGVEVGMANARWIEESEDKEHLSDDFLIVKPGLKMEYQLLKSVAVGTHINYRISSDMELSQLEQSDVDGITFGFYLDFTILK